MGKPGTLGDAYGGGPGSSPDGSNPEYGAVNPNLKLGEPGGASKTLRLVRCPVRAANRRHRTHYAIFVNGTDMSKRPDKRMSAWAQCP